MAVAVKRPDLFPAGTSVTAYPFRGGAAHGHVKPSGVALATASVATDGVVSFSSLTEGRYTLYAEVAGEPVTLTGDTETWKGRPPLRERLKSRREAVGAAL